MALRPYRHLERQRDSSDCGPACLLTVLRHWGGDASFVSVRELCGTSARGTTLAALARAGEALGLGCTGAQGSYDELQDERMPCIAHVVTPEGGDHYLVVLAISTKRVHVADPARGVRSLQRDRFEQLWSGAVLLLSPGRLLVSEKPQHWANWLWSYVRPWETWLVQSVFLGAVYTCLSLITAAFVQVIIDRIIPVSAFGLLALSGGVLVALQGVRSFLSVLRQRFLLRLNERVSLDVTDDLVGRLLQVSASFFDGHRKGDLNARLDDAVIVQSSVLSVLGSAVTDVLIVIGTTSLVFFFSIQIGWISLAGLVAYGATLLIASRRIGRVQTEARAGYGLLQSEYFDALAGVDALRAFNASGLFRRQLGLVNTVFQDRMRQLGFTQAGAYAFVEFAGATLVTLVLVVGATQVMTGQIQLGQFMAAYSLAAGAVPSLNRLSQVYMSLRRSAAAAGRLADLRSTIPELASEGRRVESILELRLEKVDFLRPGGHQILSEVEFTLSRGTLIGLLGQSGSGKSTLAGLLARTYRPSSGCLLVDGQPAEAIQLTDYRRRVVVVPEHTHLFHGTIADNIAMGRALESPTHIEAKIDALGLNPLIERFREGLGVPVGEGGRHLSSGESQIVAFLRAVLDEPDVLIVDEGANALDEDIAATLDAFLVEYAKTHAVLIISHHHDRLRRCDMFYRMVGRAVVPALRPEPALSPCD